MLKLVQPNERSFVVGGRYELGAALGAGGMGRVYRARHLTLGREFALKVMSPTFADDGPARAQFIEEARIASTISHPNIVSVVDFGEDPMLGAYMVMELIDGEALVDAERPMSIKRGLDILGQIADALEHIHSRGIIHGDIKAENVMLVSESVGARRRYVARVLDFGLAERRDPDRYTTGEMLCGTPHYIAPELACGGARTVATDIYALGVLGYLLFAGSLPFAGATSDDILFAHVHNTHEPIAVRRNESVDPAIETLIARALGKVPSERHQSMAAFRYELNAVLDMLGLRRRQLSEKRAAERPTERATLIGDTFERSRIPQALVSTMGDVTIVNRAFHVLLGTDVSAEGQPLRDTPLSRFVPGLVRGVRTAHTTGKPLELRARVFRGADQPVLHLSIWLSPLPDSVHLLVRADETASWSTGS